MNEIIVSIKIKINNYMMWMSLSIVLCYIIVDTLMMFKWWMIVSQEYISPMDCTTITGECAFFFPI